MIGCFSWGKEGVARWREKITHQHLLRPQLLCLTPSANKPLYPSHSANKPLLQPLRHSPSVKKVPPPQCSLPITVMAVPANRANRVKNMTWYESINCCRTEGPSHPTAEEAAGNQGEQLQGEPARYRENLRVTGRT